MQILTNPSLGQAVQEATSSVREAPSLLGEGAAGLGGMFFGKLTRGAVAPMLPLSGVLGNIVGGALGVIGARFFGALLFGSGSRSETAATVGALVDAMMPLSRWARDRVAAMPAFPLKNNITAALGSYYMTPYQARMAGEYAMAAQLQGFSPDDFGNDGSENFPAVASLGGVAPDFSAGGSQYGEQYLGAVGAYTPGLDVM